MRVERYDLADENDELRQENADLRAENKRLHAEVFMLKQMICEVADWNWLDDDAEQTVPIELIEQVERFRLETDAAQRGGKEG